mmetsp:Transcript_101142/g.179552  ORF Transcript_101142/g.179552 Transcript_101142/m.179552 type:complete len:417 (-) Transcript_101142:25-1275(-)|eukprot:CAMPEP_0197659974 /NCGR_PEP_ID=MMETSP1338-20131121/49938_1 /TAXON_ID=43686 ORGANISM="Pelagodinium beii, Strain RCC1491" /NCGR_SAMPLE_ID=MMETSP1338 /ASSEMBLY_ACC=CAM_ASM_000754 /LENGTH=416 /DNA_ID=CAMNT_0043237187 /DNA_START=60 /DNA_END=1310 /DNA_ORIENTATION=-
MSAAFIFLALVGLASAAPNGLRGNDGTADGFPPLQPLRAVAYGALPCSPSAPCKEGLPSEDMVQEGYLPQWGLPGRDDLGTIKALGGNSIRLYHSFGLNSTKDHGKFLDRAQELKLNVMPGMHSNEPAGVCPDFDCFESWKEATAEGFKLGYQRGESWHPAVAAVILMNEPDFYENDAMCKPAGAWCRVKAVISALDGILTAEREAGVEPGRVKLAVTWSFAMRRSIDGTVEGPGTFGFQDMVAAVANTSLAGYKPRTPLKQLQEAFRTRWIHALNTQAPWTFVHEFVSQHYAQFEPTPWFIGEYGANGQPEATIKADLDSMQSTAAEGGSFLGAAVFQFQTAYNKGGSELNFGLFSLGRMKLGETGEVCDRKSPCRTWPVYCLESKLSWLPDTLALRAEAVASAWDGSLSALSSC